MINNYFQNKKKMMTGSVEEASGYPLTLLKSKGKNLKDYKIYGDSVQGENLINYNDFVNLSGNSTYYYIDGNGNLVQKTADYRGVGDLSVVLTLQAGTYEFRTNATRKYIYLDDVASTSRFFTIDKETEVKFKSYEKENSIINPILKRAATPNDIIEIESVGDKTSNLFDNNINTTNVVKEGNDIVTKSYASGTGITPSQFLEMTGLKIGDKFTIKRSFTVEKGTASTVTGAIRFLKSDGSSDYFGLIGGSDKVKTVTIPSDFNNDTYSSLYFYGVSTAENGQRLVRFSNVQIVKGSYTNSTMPKYEPYGYKIPIKVRGKNLFDIESYGTILDKDNRPYIDISKLKIGATYTISTNDTFLFKIASGSGANVQTEGGVVSSTNVNTFTFILKDTYKSLGHLYIISTKTWKPSTKEELRTQITQLEESSTSSNYEPYIEPITTNIYLKEPLRKVGNYADYIDFKNKKVVRNIAYRQIIASNISSKSSESTENFHYYFITFSGAMTGVYINILSNIGGATFSDFNNKNKEGIFSNTNTKFFIAFFDITTLEDVRQFVTDNEVYVNYILKTPKEETIELPKIPTLKRTNIITTDTKIPSSNIWVKYYKN